MVQNRQNYQFTWELSVGDRGIVKDEDARKVRTYSRQVFCIAATIQIAVLKHKHNNNKI